jgi:type VI secretion system protein ImpC
MDPPQAPLDLVVLSDLMPQGGPGAPLLSSLQAVDKDSLAELLRAAAPALELAPTTGDTEGATRLRFAEFRAFRPDALAAQLPRARALLDLRRRCQAQGVGGAGLLATLQAIEEPMELRDAVRRALAGTAPAGPAGGRAGGAAPPAAAPAAPSAPSYGAPPAPAAPSAPGHAGDPLASLFDMVEVTGAAVGPAPETARALDRLIAEVIGVARSPGALPAAALRQITAAIDQAMGDVLRPVLHDPGFQALEAAWLGLRFLMRRVDSRSGIRVHVLATTGRGLAEAFRGVVAPFAEGRRAEGRVVLVLADFDLVPSPGELADARALAAQAEACRALVVATAHPALLGAAALGDVPPRANLADLLDDEAHRGWRELRAEEPSRWLALTVNRFMLRVPYGAEQDRVSDFAFEENPVGAEAGYLWGRAPWLVGALVASAFARSGWGAEIAGPGEQGTVEDLPVRPLTLRTGEVVQAPLEAFLSEQRVLELSQAGLIAPACRRNSDAAFVVTAPVVHRPAGDGVGGARADTARRASLPYQLFVAQVTALLGQLVAYVDPLRPPQEIATTLTKGLEFLTTSEAGPVLEVHAEAPAGGEAAPLTLHVRPVAGPLRGLPPFALELPLPGGRAGT